MLEIINLNFNFIDKPLFQNLSFSIHDNTLLHIRGCNGSGKTTLIKIITGMIYPESGTILYLNESIYKNISQYQQKILYVGHKNGIHQGLTVLEHCQLTLRQNSSNLSVHDIMHQFNFLGMQNKRCALLSCGQKRRLGLIKLLISNANIWFLDEPFVGLDDVTLNLLMHQMQKHITNGGTIILTSHQALPLSFDQYREFLL